MNSNRNNRNTDTEQNTHEDPMEHLRMVQAQRMGQPQLQSPLGTASFIMGMTMFVLLLFGFVAGLLEMDRMDQLGYAEGELSTAMIVIAFGILVGLLINVVGTIFGLIGLFQRSRKRGLAIAGFILCVIPILVAWSILMYALFAT